MRTELFRKGRPGFTMVEIIIAVVMMGIVAAFVIPKVVQPNERVIAGEAFRTLAAVRQAQNRYYNEHQFWAGDLGLARGDLDITVPPSRYFDPPDAYTGSCTNCTEPDHQIGGILRNDASYRLIIRVDGKIECYPAGTSTVCTDMRCDPTTHLCN